MAQKRKRGSCRTPNISLPEVTASVIARLSGKGKEVTEADIWRALAFELMEHLGILSIGQQAAVKQRKGGSRKDSASWAQDRELVSEWLKRLAPDDGPGSYMGAVRLIVKDPELKKRFPWNPRGHDTRAGPYCEKKHVAQLWNRIKRYLEGALERQLCGADACDATKPKLPALINHRH